MMERPRRTEAIQVLEVDREGRPALALRHDFTTNERHLIEFDQGYRRRAWSATIIRSTACGGVTMSEAAGDLAPQPQGGEATRLIALLERGDLVEADNLTIELATETATWIDHSGYTAEQFAGKVKDFWVRTYQRIIGKEEAEEIERVWIAAAGRKTGSAGG